MNRHCEIGFLILNYMTYWETFACVRSIFDTVGEEKFAEGKCCIIIVDNGSTNDSVEKLRSAYSNSRGVYILVNETNLGFAKGNNVGFTFLKNEHKPQFIVMINSDIILTERKFFEKLSDYYSEYQFAVAGPDVILPNGVHLNPMYSRIVDSESAEKWAKQCKIRIRMCKLHVEPVYAAFMRIKRKLAFHVKKECCDSLGLNQGTGMQLHGCFLIFSEQYIEKFDGLYEKTFLYGEEDLLRLRCHRAGLKMVYLSNISAIHNESRTEKFVGGAINQRHLRRAQNMLASVKLIKEYLLDESLI